MVTFRFRGRTTGRARRADRALTVAPLDCNDLEPLSGSITLTVFTVYGAPIVITGLAQALTAVWDGLHGGPALAAVDAALLILVEGGIQVLFLVTFVRTRRPGSRRSRS